MIKSVKEAEVFFSSIAKGMAASLSAYLMAVAVVPGGASGVPFWTMVVAIVSLVVLSMYVVIGALKYKMGMEESCYPELLFGIGFGVGLFAYSMILGAINSHFVWIFWLSITALAGPVYFLVKSGPAPTYDEMGKNKEAK